MTRVPSDLMLARRCPRASRRGPNSGIARSFADNGRKTATTDLNAYVFDTLDRSG